MAKSNVGNRGYLAPKVGDPDLMRKHKNGQAINPPTFMEYGGFKSSKNLRRDDPSMGLEKGGPKANQGKPI